MKGRPKVLYVGPEKANVIVCMPFKIFGVEALYK